MYLGLDGIKLKIYYGLQIQWLTDKFQIITKSSYKTQGLVTTLQIRCLLFKPFYGHWNMQSLNLKDDTLHKKINFSIKNSFSKCDQIRRKLRIWSHLLKKSLIESLIFYCSDLFKHYKSSLFLVKVNVLQVVDEHFVQWEQPL